MSGFQRTQLTTPNLVPLDKDHSVHLCWCFRFALFKALLLFSIFSENKYDQVLKRLINLFKRQGFQNVRESFHPLVYSPVGYNIHSWARLIPETSWGSPTWVIGATALVPCSPAFQGVWAGCWVWNGAAETWTCPHMGAVPQHQPWSNFLTQLFLF